MFQSLKIIGFLILIAVFIGCRGQSNPQGALVVPTKVQVEGDQTALPQASVDSGETASRPYKVFDIQGRHGKGEWKEEVRR